MDDGGFNSTGEQTDNLESHRHEASDHKFSATESVNGEGEATDVKLCGLIPLRPRDCDFTGLTLKLNGESISSTETRMCKRCLKFDHVQNFPRMEATIPRPDFSNNPHYNTICKVCRANKPVRKVERFVINSWTLSSVSNLEFLDPHGNQMLMCRPCGHFYPAAKENPLNKTEHMRHCRKCDHCANTKQGLKIAHLFGTIQTVPDLSSEPKTFTNALIARICGRLEQLKPTTLDAKKNLATKMLEDYNSGIVLMLEEKRSREFDLEQKLEPRLLLSVVRFSSTNATGWKSQATLHE